MYKIASVQSKFYEFKFAFHSVIINKLNGIIFSLSSLDLGRISFTLCSISYKILTIYFFEQKPMGNCLRPHLWTAGAIIPRELQVAALSEFPPCKTSSRVDVDCPAEKMAWSNSNRSRVFRC